MLHFYFHFGVKTALSDTGKCFPGNPNGSGWVSVHRNLAPNPRPIFVAPTRLASQLSGVCGDMELSQNSWGPMVMTQSIQK
jgi:hypothetical protein